MANILRLPIELIQHITTSISREDVAHFSATCRDLRSKTADEVRERCFTDRTFMITQETSLKVLLEISQHPVYVTSMKRIAFSFAEVFAEPLDSDSYAHLKGKHRGQTLKKQHKLYSQLVTTQSEFRDSHSAVKYLRSALINFKRAGNIPAIVAGGMDFLTEDYQEQAWGYTRLKQLLAPYPTLLLGLRCENEHSFRTLTRAICEAGNPVTSLTLGCHGFGIHPSELDCSWDSPSDHSYAALRKLDLYLTDERCYEAVIGHIDPTVRLSIVTQSEEAGYFWQREKKFCNEMGGFMHLLHQARNLESLIVGTDRVMFRPTRSDGEIIYALLVSAMRPHIDDGTLALRNLRHLELHGVGTDIETILEIVHATRKSLKTLRIVPFFTPVCPPGARRFILEVHGGDLDLDGWLGFSSPRIELFSENAAEALEGYAMLHPDMWTWPETGPGEVLSWITRDGGAPGEWEVRSVDS